jgi:hypothetical protein
MSQQSDDVKKTTQTFRHVPKIVIFVKDADGKMIDFTFSDVTSFTFTALERDKSLKASVNRSFQSASRAVSNMTETISDAIKDLR